MLVEMKMISIEELQYKALGYSSNSISCETLKPELGFSSEELEEDLFRINQSFETFYTMESLNEANTNAKIKMITKLRHSVLPKIKNKEAATSLESYFDTYIQSSEGIISSLIHLCVTIILKIIAFIAKTIIWIAKKIINIFATCLQKLTRSKPAKPKKADGLITRMIKWTDKKIQSIANYTDTQSFEDDENHSKNPVEASVDLVKTYIKKDSKESSNEEIMFYKAILINGNPDKLKEMYNIFNKSTSDIKTMGQSIYQFGAKTFNRGNRDVHDSSHENLLSLESDEQNSNHSIKTLSEIFSQSKIADSTDINYRSDMITCIKNMKHNLVTDEENIWLSKFKTILENGEKELTVQNESLKKQSKLIKSLDESKISEDNKENVKIYKNKLEKFQRYVLSYTNCVKYFTKYYNIKVKMISFVRARANELNLAA
jgi:hypothetical protein